MSTFIVGAVLLVLVLLAVRHIVKKRREGGCGCGCDGCAAKCGEDSTKAQRRN